MVLLSLARGLAAAGFLLENAAFYFFGLDTRAMSDPLFFFFFLLFVFLLKKKIPTQSISGASLEYGQGQGPGGIRPIALF